VARVVTILPSLSSLANPVATPNASAALFDGNFKI
jgi:hypothetical protein